MIVAAWSNEHFYSGTTSNLKMLMLMRKILYGERGIILKLHLNGKQACSMDMGLLMKLIKTKLHDVWESILSGKVYKEQFDQCCQLLESICSKESVREQQDNYTPLIKTLLYRLLYYSANCYENVYLDCGCGINEYVQLLISQSNLLCICLSQNLENIHQLFYDFPINHNRIYYVFGRYQHDRGVPIKDLFSKYPLLKEDNTYTISFSGEYREAELHETVDDFLFSGVLSEGDEQGTQGDHSQIYFHEIATIARELSSLMTTIRYG